jgi:PAS domain-containing protein
MTDKEIRSGGDSIVQKQAEEALRESEERYRSILNASPDDITNTENGEPGKGTQFEITVPTGAWRIDSDANDVYGTKP